MTTIKVRTFSVHQKRLQERQGRKVKDKFYLVKNRAGETLKGFDTKREALAYSKKRRGI